MANPYPGGGERDLKFVGYRFYQFQFDGRATTVQVGNEVHPAKLTDCLRPIPAGATVPIDVVIQGHIDGGRSNLSIENEFRIMLPGDTGAVWSF